jgi:hypothetical protein
MYPLVGDKSGFISLDVTLVTPESDRSPKMIIKIKNLFNSMDSS